MADFFAELKRRHIYRVAAAYAVVAWVLLQLVNNVAPILDLPLWVARAFLLLLVIGFPAALFFAWMRELTPADSATARATTGKLDWALIGALVVVIGLVSYQQLAPSPSARTAEQQQATITAGAANAAGISIAVLPFANLSGDAAQEFFSDGMTEEIMTALAKVSALRIVGRESAFQFKGQKTDMHAIGQALGASYLIEGSVRKAGERVRITAQLVQADNGVSLWTESYDRLLQDIFATQSDIAQAIAGALRVPLGLAQGDTLVRDRTKDLESYDQYLRARGLLRARGQEPVAGAIAVLEQVVARDPGFAAAWALLGQAYVVAPSVSTVQRDGSVEEARLVVQSSFDKAEKAAREAIRLDSRNALAHAALARSQTRSGRWAEAEELFKQALVLDPDEPEVLANYAQMLTTVGRLREALSIGDKLRVLEPLVPLFAAVTARSMQENGQIAASIPILEALPPNSAGGIRSSALANAYASEGRFAEAADTLLLTTGTGNLLVSRRGVEDAARLLRSAPTKVNAPASLPVLGIGLNFVYAYVGALPRVMENAERALAIGYNLGGSSLWLPAYAPLRKTERFKAYARKVGLVDYWRARGWPDLCRPMGADDFVCD